MELVVRWQDVETGDWKDFDVSDIMEQSRDSVIGLFSFDIPVIAKQGDTYIVNSKILLKQYQHNKKKVVLFENLISSGENISRVGLICR